MSEHEGYIKELDFEVIKTWRDFYGRNNDN